MMNINQSKNIFTKSDISSARKLTKKQCDLQKAKKSLLISQKVKFMHDINILLNKDCLKS